MKVKNSDNTALHHFPSIYALREWSESPMRLMHNDTVRTNCVRSGGGHESWLGVDSVAEVEKALVEGYAKGADQIDALYDKFVARLPRAIDIKRRRVFSEIGDSLDILAVYAGRFDKAWSTTKRAMKHGTSIVRIVVDIGGNCGMSPQQLQNRGLAALALSRIIVKAGYSCEIVAAIGIRNAAPRGKAMLLSCVVKPRHAHADSRTLAATLALAGFFRTVFFRGIVKAADEQGKDCDSCLGQAMAVDSMLDVEQGRVLQVITPTLNRVADAEKWISDSLALFGSQTLTAEQGAR